METVGILTVVAIVGYIGYKLAIKFNWFKPSTNQDSSKDA